MTFTLSLGTVPTRLGGSSLAVMGGSGLLVATFGPSGFTITTMTLVTFGDVRKLIGKHLPKDCRDGSTWRHVAAELEKAAAGGDTV